VFTYSSQQGLNAKTVLQIVVDGLGRLWLGCSRGIVRVAKKDLEDVAAGRRPYLHPLTYGANDGMLAEECTGGFTPAGLLTRDGLVCISTVRGLVFIDPAQQQTRAELPRVWIESVRLNGAQPAVKLQITDGELELGAGQRDIEIQYTGINFSAPQVVRFRYRMEGLDTDWVEAGTRRSAYYRLPAGDFRFEVMASSADGVWTQPGPALDVVAHPFVWETAWFKGMVAIALIGAFAGFLRYAEKRRYQRQLETLRTQHAIERERLRISKDMHDDIGSTLTQVAQLTEIARGEPGLPVPAQNQLERIRLQARAAVQALDEIVWATNPKNDNLSQFAEYLCRFADECFELSATRCWVEVPTDLPPIPLRADLRHNVFLAVKESFSNVLKHSGAREAWLRLRLTSAGMELEIEDSGKGFTPSPPIPGSSHGNGLRNMKSRLDECDGHAEISSTPGKGTRVRFSVMLPQLKHGAPPGNPNVV
jgi:signal transduction histidine kinase